MQVRIPSQGKHYELPHVFLLQANASSHHFVHIMAVVCSEKRAPRIDRFAGIGYGRWRPFVSPLLPITGCAVAAAVAAMSPYSVGSVRCWGPRGKAASTRASSIFDKCNSLAPAFSSACVGLEALGIVKSAGRRVKKASAT